MASYNNLAPTQVKYGNGSEGAWHDPISSSGGTFAFGRSGQGHFVTFMIFKLPTSISNITKIELTLYAHGTVSGTYTTIAKLVKNGQGPSNTSNPANWYSYPGLSTSNTVSASYSSNLSKRTYTFSSGLSTLTGGETIWVWLQGDSSSSYSEGRWSSSYPIYLNITYGGTTPTNYTITYDPNGAPGSSKYDSVASGSKYTLRSCPWTRSGYTFKGWNASPTGTTPASSPQTCTGNKTWYAIWQSDASKKTIFFYPISTSGLVGDYPGQKIASSKDSYFKFPTMSDLKWTRSGFTLQYWNTNRQLSGTNYYPGSSYQIAYSDLQDSYYAVWQPSTPSTVTFTFDPGSYSDDSKVSYSRSYNYSTTKKASLPDDDYYFTGTTITHDKKWYYLTCNCGNGSFSNGVSVAQVSNDFTQKQTQYVQTAWQLNDTVTSGDPFNSYMPNQNVTFYPYWGNTSNSWIYDVTLNIPSEKPTRSGYSFVEWNTNSSGTGTSYQPGDSIRQLKTDGQFSNKTLYAIWEDSEFKITFSPGNYGRGSSEQLTTTNGQLTTLPSNYFTRQAGTTYYFNYYLQGGTMSTPPGFSVDTSATYGPHYQTSNKTTYYHNYWNTDPNGSPKNNMGVDCWQCNITYSFTSDMTIYPEWGSSVPKYTLPTPTKVGYKFVAWNTNASGTGTNYAAGTEFALRSNKTFYAIWEPEWTIKINNGTTWGDYHVWIYTGATSNNGWQQAIPYVYDGSNWKLTKI